MHPDVRICRWQSCGRRGSAAATPDSISIGEQSRRAATGGQLRHTTEKVCQTGTRHQVCGRVALLSGLMSPG
jgi:hypothetical protein